MNTAIGYTTILIVSTILKNVCTYVVYMHTLYHINACLSIHVQKTLSMSPYFSTDTSSSFIVARVKFSVTMTNLRAMLSFGYL